MNALPLLLTLWMSAAPPPSAATLNTEGFRLYQAGRYEDALEKFRAATRANPRMALAHYNVAATLGVLRKRGQVCEAEAYRETIVQYLQRAVALDKRRLARAREDADLDVIHDTLAWQELQGRSPGRIADVPEILQRVTWSQLTAGGVAPRVTLTFPAPGQALLTTVGVDGRREERGTYTLRGRAVTLTLPQRAPVRGSLTDKGALKLGALGTFVDNPPECDA
ncbi:tetratricopeptide repeat protein [Archangium primigenium]|uniref:tetratricopeptide repeat protein n=1 Tax=[Archangium] primigenium TaxID=2792470 RepID=UPI00195E81B8|nr:tetratricopeptide repeat protein [Archangium primigenium]